MSLNQVLRWAMTLLLLVWWSHPAYSVPLGPDIKTLKLSHENCTRIDNDWKRKYVWIVYVALGQVRINAELVVAQECM